MVRLRLDAAFVLSRARVCFDEDRVIHDGPDR